MKVLLSFCLLYSIVVRDVGSILKVGGPSPKRGTLPHPFWASKGHLHSLLKSGGPWPLWPPRSYVPDSGSGNPSKTLDQLFKLVRRVDQL